MRTVIRLPGCRHDVLGHAFKAIGVLRALAECADAEHRDGEALGWWDTGTACFLVQLSQGHDGEWLRQFFVEHYVPTPIIASWNKSGGVTDKLEVTISGDRARIDAFRQRYKEPLKDLGLSPKKKLAKSGELRFAIEAADRDRLIELVERCGLTPCLKKKTSGKKDGVIPNVARISGSSGTFEAALVLAREFASQLQDDDLPSQRERDLLLQLRDRFDDSLAEAFDALSVLHLSAVADNPVFVKRGRPGDKVNADIFLNFWDYFLAFKRNPTPFFAMSLLGGRGTPMGIGKDDLRGKGTPFFPDPIKTYNQGLAWVTEELPFCPLDYLLAVEGGLAMRGATSKGLSAQSNARAAFPFVFETADSMVDEQGNQLRLAPSFWFPLWERPTTFAELESFIVDAQARLPRKDCRFSSDFARAVVGLGVDAGFIGFQEFKFKLKGANVPWPTTGRLILIQTGGQRRMRPLSELLSPLDESRFLEQFRFTREARTDLHPYRVPVLDAIDVAVAEPTAANLVEILARLAELNRQLTLSKSLREKIGHVQFVRPLPAEPWEEALHELEGDAEYTIARAVASIVGHEKQTDGRRYSEVEPFLGSILPLRRARDSWYLPDPPSAQAVWSGTHLCRDLTRALSRRHLDSMEDDRPAFAGSRSAPVSSILAFLRGELDDIRIGRLILALSQLDWKFRRSLVTTKQNGEGTWDPIPPAYAALRALVEVGLENADNEHSERGTRRRSPKAIALLSETTPRAVAASVGEALRALAIVGVPNSYGEASRMEKRRLRGRDVVSLTPDSLSVHAAQASRIAAAVLVPIDFRDRWKIFRAITLPQSATD